MVQAVFILLMAALVAVDQIIKYFVSANLAVGESCLTVPGFIEIQYCRNFGGMVGTFGGKAGALAVFSLVVIIIGVVGLLVGLHLKKIKFGFVPVCVLLILSGGIGNLIDRVRLGYVVDYINVLFVRFYVFNFADCLVTVGAFLIVFYEIYQMIKEKKKGGQGDCDA